jgi:hypothetical protein
MTEYRKCKSSKIQAQRFVHFGEIIEICYDMIFGEKFETSDFSMDEHPVINPAGNGSETNFRYSV